MSQYKFENKEKKLEFLVGFDRPMNMVFMVVHKNDGEIVYSNIDDTNIKFWEQRDFNYFVNIAREKFDTVIPEHIIATVVSDATVY